MRVLERMAFIVPVIIAVGAVIWGILREKPPESTHLVVNKSVPMDAGEEDAAVSGKLAELGPMDTSTGGNASMTRKKTTRRRMAKVSRTKEQREVIFTPHPLAVKIVVDDEEPFDYGPANRKRMLEVGTHKISFVPNDARRFEEKTWQIDIPSGTPPFRFRGRLEWRPAALFVESNVDAVVTVPGRAADRTNRPFKVDIEKGPEEKISVFVSADGYLPLTKQVTISAGEVARVKVTLTESKKNDPSP